jgi:histidine ammonia-lyase
MSRHAENFLFVINADSSLESNPMAEIVLNGEDLTFDQVTAVAYGSPGSPRVSLAENAKANVLRSAAAVDTLLERGEIAYGITTGFGAFKDKIISRDEVEELQRNIVVSHAVGVGKPFDIPTVRAIMLIRANTLARGFSGIRLETLELILQFLNSGSIRVSRKRKSRCERRSRPVAHFACVLIGEGKAEFKERFSAERCTFEMPISTAFTKSERGTAL